MNENGSSVLQTGGSYVYTSGAGYDYTSQAAAVASLTTIDEIVVTLLAVLELVRRGEIGIVQPDLFGPIRLEALGQPAAPLGGGVSVGAPELAE